MIFDAHTHIHFPAYNKDREEVIKRAQKAGVKMIAVGTNLKTSQGAIAVAEKYPDDIWATVGFHPTEIRNSSLGIQNLRMLIKHPKVAAIGECGLDYYRLSVKSKEQSEKQKETFLEQIKLAEEFRKPLMIHCRSSKNSDDAYEDLLDIIKSTNFSLPKIVHFFAGSAFIAKKLLEAGCYFTFGGVITFVRDYDKAINVVPLEKIMLETDAPYVSPAPYRGQRNEPAYVIEVAKKLAEIKGVDYDRVIKQTNENIKAVFGINYEI